MLKDLGSTSGTFVDGQLVEQALLGSGQVFSLGEVRLRFEADSPAESTPPAASRIRAARQAGRVRVRLPASREQSFGARLASAFLYPLRKDGVVLLITGTVFFSILNALKFFARFAALKGIGLGSVISLAFLLLLTAVGVGYLTSYMRRVVTSTAMGEQAAPDWPDLSDFVADIVSPLFQLAVTVLASLLPAILVAMLVPRVGSASEVAVGIACGLGALYFPMAFLAVTMFDSVLAVNPLLVVPSIVKVPGQYFFIVALFGVVLLAAWCGDNYLPKLVPTPIAASIISTIVQLYLLTIQARAVGLLYLANKERLGWFGRH